MILSVAVHYGTAIHNTFNLLTTGSIPYYILGLKFAYVFYVTILFYIHQIYLRGKYYYIWNGIHSYTDIFSQL